MALLGKGRWLVRRCTEQRHAEMELLRHPEFRRNLGGVKEIRIVRARRSPDGNIETTCARPCRHCSLSLRHYAKICKKKTGFEPRIRYSMGRAGLSDACSARTLPEGSALSSGHRRRYNNM